MRNVEHSCCKILRHFIPQNDRPVSWCVSVPSSVTFGDSFPRRGCPWGAALKAFRLFPLAFPTSSSLRPHKVRLPSFPPTAKTAAAPLLVLFPQQTARRVAPCWVCRGYPLFYHSLPPMAKACSLRRSSSPHETRCAGLSRGPRKVPNEVRRMRCQMFGRLPSNQSAHAVPLPLPRPKGGGDPPAPSALHQVTEVNLPLAT